MMSSGWLHYQMEQTDSLLRTRKEVMSKLFCKEEAGCTSYCAVDSQQSQGIAHTGKSLVSGVLLSCKSHAGWMDLA